MDVLVHASKPDEPRASVSDRTDDASQSWVPLVGFARERRSHREARSGMPRRERHEWSVPIMKAAAELKVLRVAVIHGRQRSTGDPLAQTSNAGCKENGFRHVKRSTCQPRHSCDAAGRKKTGTNNKWTRPAEEREIARGVLQIVASWRRFSCSSLAVRASRGAMAKVANTAAAPTTASPFVSHGRVATGAALSF